MRTQSYSLGRGHLLFDTPKAVRVQLSDAPLWIPRSQLRSDPLPDQETEIIVSLWWAGKNGLVEADMYAGSVDADDPMLELGRRW